MLFKRPKEETQQSSRRDAGASEAPQGEGTPSQTPSSAALPARLRLGELLTSAGILTQEQLRAGLERQKQSGGFLGQALVELRFITQETLMSFLVKQCRIPHINLLEYQVSPDILASIPEEICVEYGVLPIDKLGRILTVAMVDPLDVEAIERVRNSCPEFKIKPILCEWQHFNQVAQRLFKRSDLSSDEVSMASLGLGAGVETKTARADKTAPPPPKSQQEQTPVQPATGTPPAAPKSALRTGGEGQRAAPSATAAPQEPTRLPDELADAMRASVREVLGEAMTTFTQASQKSTPAVPAGDLTQSLRDTMQEAVQQALTSALSRRDTQPGGAAGQQPGPSIEELTRLMQGSIHDAIHEAMTSVAQMIQAQVEQSEHAAAELRKALTHETEEREQTTEAARKALETLQQARSDQEARLLQVTEAATQAAQAAQAAVEAVLATQKNQAAQLLDAARQAQLAASKAEEEAKRAADQAESTAVSEHVRKGLQKAGAASRRKAKQAAALLGKAESDALEAIEGPGLKLRTDERIQAAIESETPLPGYSFDTFLVAKPNVFTVQLAKAVAEEPGGQYNPFFLYGDVGLGKTHLINAIGNHILLKNEKSNVGYVSSSRFARKLTAALEDHALDRFREVYCEWDVLILDDIQFLGGRIEAQEEFFHIFNALAQEKRQIIIAADNPPDRLGQLEKRLVSRFGSGIVACLHPPDWETRLKILKQQAQQAKVKISDDVMGLIATRVTSDIRRMTGSLRKVIAFADLVGQEITPELVAEILSHLGLDEQS